jgi:hypothetical protein
VRVILAFALSLNGSDEVGVRPDRVKHFFMSAFVQSVSYSAFRVVRVEHDAAMIAASGVTFAVGAGKEVADHRAGRQFDMVDLLWDVAGGAAAAAVLEQSHR